VAEFILKHEGLHSTKYLWGILMIFCPITVYLKKIMLTLIKKLFGVGASINFAQLVKDGAAVIDVRSKDEFDSGHVNGSINIPVDQLSNNLSKLKDKNKPVIVCCASGMRSAAAKRMLLSNGYTAVHNGGGWSSLQNKL
jgi:phage shock protein E